MEHHLFFRVLSLAVLLVAGTAIAPAQSAGYDLFQTGSGASVDLSSLGLGVVPLKGVAIESCTGNTDTIMHRTASVPTGGGAVPVNVYALFLKSINPVTFSGQSSDVYVTINNSGGTISTSVLPQPDSLSASTGTVTVRTDGTFDSSITVNADVIFVKAGTSVTNSANYLGHQPASAISLTSSNSTWSSTAPSGYPNCATFPSGGFFVVQVAHVNGPHPIVTAQQGGGGCIVSGPNAAVPTSGTKSKTGAKGGAKTSTSPTGDLIICHE